MSLPRVKDPAEFDIGLLVMVASGTSTPKEIADTYGMTLDQLEALSSQPLFRQSVEGVKADLMKNGSMISIRAGFVLAEVAIPEMQMLLQSALVEPADKIKATLALTKLHEMGGGTAARDKGESGKTGVTITINTNPVMIQRAAPVAPVIEVAATEITIGSD
jgi:hypothetical protein